MDDNSARRPATRRSNQSSANAAQALIKNRKKPATIPSGVRAVVKRGTSATNLLVDLSRMEMTSMMRYVAFYNLEVPPKATKRELTAVIAKHYSCHPYLRDAEVISSFLYSNEKYMKALGITDVETTTQVQPQTKDSKSSKDLAK